MEKLFQGIFDSTAVNLKLTDFLICILASLAIGAILTLSYTYKTRYTKSFLLTLLLLPSIVCVVIMMVNGNLGAGVAVAGAFSLVRFRSVPGTAKEIAMLFLAMGSGLLLGMGYVGYALLFVLIMCAVNLIYAFILSKTEPKTPKYRTVRITIPEDLDYTDVFSDLFGEYTSRCELTRVKSTNMGSMFRLYYNVTLKDASREKEMIDRLRERNGNLEITVSNQDTGEDRL